MEEDISANSYNNINNSQLNYTDNNYEEVNENIEDNDYGILTLANEILQTLGQNIILENNEYLFDDEIYISILSIILNESNIDQSVGTTPEEKSENLNKLIDNLSNILGIDLSKITGSAIIYDKDEESVKLLLELIHNLIEILKGANDENEDNDGNIQYTENNSQRLQDKDLIVDSEYLEDYNKSLNNNKNNKSTLDNNKVDNSNPVESDNLNNYDNNDNNINNSYYDINKTSKRSNSNNVINDNESNIQSIREKDYENNNNFNNLDINNNINNDNISILSDKEPPNSTKLKEDTSIKEYEKNTNDNQQDIDKADRMTESNLNENSKFDIEAEKQKSCNDITYLSQSGSKLNYSENDSSKYIKQMNLINKYQDYLYLLKDQFTNEEIEEFDQLKEKEKIQILFELKKKYFINEEVIDQNKNISNEEINDNLNEDNKNNNINNNINNDNENSKSVVNISRISEVSKSKENSEAPSQQHHKKLLSNKHNNSNSFNKVSNNKMNFKNISEGNSNNSNTQSKQPSLESKINKNDNANINSINYNNKSESNKNINNNSVYENSNKISTNKKISTTNSNKNNSINKNIANNSIKKSLIKSSESSYKSKNNNNKINDSSKYEKSKSNISMSTVKSIKSNSRLKSENNNESISQNNNNNINDNNISKHSLYPSDRVIEEMPLNDNNLKFEIMKEFKRIYGTNLHRLFLKENIKKSSNTLELIIRNLKVAKDKMSKLKSKNQKDPDDLLTKEFLVKYEKELNYIIKYYKEEEKKRDFLKQKAVKTISQNINLMKRVQEIGENNIKKEIERRSKSRDIKSGHYKIKLCNDLYSRALELEKHKYIQENKIKNEIRSKENESKRLIMTQIENYYKDKINILKDILKKEKYEKEIQYRAQIQFFSKLDREKRKDFKDKVDKIFMQLDEEDKKATFLEQNDNKMMGVLKAYYNN